MAPHYDKSSVSLLPINDPESYYFEGGIMWKIINTPDGFDLVSADGKRKQHYPSGHRGVQIGKHGLIPLAEGEPIPTR